MRLPLLGCLLGCLVVPGTFQTLFGPGGPGPWAPSGQQGQGAARRTRANAPEVVVEQGRLLGRSLVTARGTPYDAFSGIPYAAPPIGDLRFKAPRPPRPWSGVRDARREGRICTQPVLNVTKVLGTRIKKSMEPLHSEEIPGFVRAQPWLLQVVTNVLLSGEDCLFVNVYTPRAAARANRATGARGLPVLFWIFGGGFVWGDGGFAFYDPEALMDRGIVVVTFNYRVGPLGFLSLGRGSGVPGNAGIKDQAAALRWTHSNIAVFGGDPDRITVWGESAGAVGTMLHVMNPRSGALIHKAIASSGSSVHSWATVPARHALKRARRLAPWVRCRANATARQLADCLRRVPAQRLTHLHEKAIVPEDLRFVLGAVPFVPAIEEPDAELDALDEPFITEHPFALLAKRKYAKVPLMLGFNSGEALILYTGLTREPSESSLQLMDKDITCLVRDDMMPSLSRKQAEELGHRIRRFYFGHENPVKPYGRSLDTFFDMMSGLFMHLETLMLARYIAADPDPAAAPVYVYRFTFVGALSPFKNILRIRQKATCHGDELAYVWNMHIAPESKPLSAAAPEYRVRETFSKMVTSFIKTGSPTPGAARNGTTRAWSSGSGSGQTPAWPAFDSRDWAYMDVSAEPHADRDFRPREIAFWDEMFAKLVSGPGGRIAAALLELEAQRAQRAQRDPPALPGPLPDPDPGLDLSTNLLEP